MLRELLLRDWTLHRRVLLAAAVYPLLLAVAMGVSPSADPVGVFVLFFCFGLILIAFLPLSLQAREGMLGTLGDLLSLPVARERIVRLRFVEGVLAYGGYSILMAIAWMLLRGTSLRSLLELYGSPLVLWMLFLFLAYPLPFFLRWRGKGLVLAFALLGGGAFGYLRFVLLGPRGGKVMALLAGLGHLQAALGATFARVMAFGWPLLLLALFYGLSVWVLERVEA